MNKFDNIIDIKLEHNFDENTDVFVVLFESATLRRDEPYGGKLLESSTDDDTDNQVPRITLRSTSPAEFIMSLIPQLPRLRLLLEGMHHAELIADRITGNSSGIPNLTRYIDEALATTLIEATNLRIELFQEIDEAFWEAFWTVFPIIIEHNILYNPPTNIYDIPYFDLPREIRDVINQAHYNVLVWFYQQVDHGKPWDIKVERVWEETIGIPFPGDGNKIIFRGIVQTPEQLGNLTYGYIGATLGIPFEVLLAGSVYAAHTAGRLRDIPQIFNELENWFPIYRGYRMFKTKQHILDLIKRNITK